MLSRARVSGRSRRSVAGADRSAVALFLYGGTAAAALAAPRLASRLRRRLPASIADLAAMGGLVGIGWSAIAVAERVRPFEDEWNRSRGDVVTDDTTLLVTGAAAEVISDLVTRPATRWLGGRNLGRMTRALPRPLQVVFTLAAFDLIHSIHHRLLHERGILWRLHAVHHSAERLYWLNATRFHIIEMVIDGIGERLVLAVLGADPATLMAHQVFRGIFGQIQHGNVDLDSGPLNRVLSTPERHRWHHSADTSEGLCNYGAVVCIWDRLWRTDFLPADRRFDAVLGNGLPRFPTRFAGQQLAPFRWHEITADAGDERSS